jgi:hypothetical protein
MAAVLDRRGVRQSAAQHFAISIVYFRVIITSSLPAYNQTLSEQRAASVKQRL